MGKDVTKQNLDNAVRFEQIFAPGAYVIVERPNQTTTAAEHLALENYFELCRRRLGPYRAVSEGPEILNIDQDGMTNTVSINLVTCTTLPDGPATTSQVQQSDDVQAKNKPSLHLEDNELATEYVVDVITRNVDTSYGPR